MMITRLRHLLSLPPHARTPEEHEAAFDDFFQTIGGSRFTDRYAVPAGTKNADYVLPVEGGVVIIELKQMTAHATAGPFPVYFEKFVSERQVTVERQGRSGRRISPDSLSRDDWRDFNDRFRANVATHVRQGYRQLKASAKLAQSAGDRVIASALWLHNSGDVHLPLDLLVRQSMVTLHPMWAGRQLRSLKMVACSCWDFWESPLVTIETAVTGIKMPGLPRPPFQLDMFYPEGDGSPVSMGKTITDEWIKYAVTSYGGTRSEVKFPTGTLAAVWKPGAELPRPRVFPVGMALVPVQVIPLVPDPALPPASPTL